MYNIKDYEPYVGGVLSETRRVLAWSQETGYVFTKVYLMLDSQKIVAVERSE